MELPNCTTSISRRQSPLNLGAMFMTKVKHNFSLRLKRKELSVAYSLIESANYLQLYVNNILLVILSSFQLYLH